MNPAYAYVAVPTRVKLAHRLGVNWLGRCGKVGIRGVCASVYLIDVSGTGWVITKGDLVMVRPEITFGEKNDGRGGRALV